MQLPRMQLFEFTDLPWMPTILRDLCTDFLSFFWTFDGGGRLTPTVSVATDLVHEVLPTLKDTPIVDLACGAGKAAFQMVSQLRSLGHDGLELVLTDLYPNAEALGRLAEAHPLVSFEPQPVDATCCSIQGFRTIFGSYHHFAPQAAVAILKDVVDRRGEGIGIFEVVDKSLWNFSALVMCAPLWILLATPFVTPMTRNRLLFTYIIPVIPVTMSWDGIASFFRTYSEDQLWQFIKQADPANTFDWHIRKQVCGPAKVTALVGYPRDGGNQAHSPTK